MTTAVGRDEHRAARTAIDAHFTGRAAPATEMTMRAHLPGCPDCRAFYRRHHLLACLDPAAVPAEERIGRGLGFRTRRGPSFRDWLRTLVIPVGATAVAAAALLIVARPGADVAPVARGANAVTGPRAAAPARVSVRPGCAHARAAPGIDAERGGAGVRVHESFGAPLPRDLRRRRAAARLLVPSRVARGCAPPAALRAAAGPGPHELPEAVQHAVGGQRLTIHALFAASRRRRRGDRGRGCAAAPAGGALVSRLGGPMSRCVARDVDVLRSRAIAAAVGARRAAGRPSGVGRRARPRAFALIIGVNAERRRRRSPAALRRRRRGPLPRAVPRARARGPTCSSGSTTNTRRLHPQAVAEALTRARRELERRVEQVARATSRTPARAASRRSLYFVYAGHGDVDERRGYLALEDARLFGSRSLSRGRRARRAPTETHFIVDACYSLFLALRARPGRRAPRPRTASRRSRRLAARPGVGLPAVDLVGRREPRVGGVPGGGLQPRGPLRPARRRRRRRRRADQLSARSRRSSQRANAAIPNERFRPDVYAQRAARRRNSARPAAAPRQRLRLEGPTGAAHYLLEDARGVRLLTSTATGHACQSMRPAGRRAAVPAPGRRRHGAVRAARDGPVSLAIARNEPPAQRGSRGAAQDAFNQLFALVFDGDAVDVWARRRTKSARAGGRRAPPRRGPPAGEPSANRGKTAIGVGVAAALAAGGLRCPRTGSTTTPRRPRASAMRPRATRASPPATARRRACHRRRRRHRHRPVAAVAAAEQTPPPPADLSALFGSSTSAQDRGDVAILNIDMFAPPSNRAPSIVTGKED